MKKERHGMRHTLEYKVWAKMKERCFNPNTKEYHNYGGRGITVCDSWKNSFTQFYQDMGPRPSKKHSIDRIDNDGNYEPGNCRWATREEQSRNKRVNRVVIFQGKRVLASDLSRDAGMGRSTVADRMNAGWDLVEAVTTPPQRTTIVQFEGKDWTIGELSAKYGISRGALSMRLKNGWDVKLALETPVKSHLPPIDIGNGQFKTIRQVSRESGLSPNLIRKAISMGFSGERILKQAATIGGKNKKYTCGDKSLTIVEWSKESGISYDTIHQRLGSGVAVCDAVSKPIARYSRYVTFRGETWPLRELASVFGQSIKNVEARIRLGWDLEKALTTPVKRSAKG